MVIQTAVVQINGSYNRFRLITDKYFRMDKSRCILINFYPDSSNGL